MPDCMKPDPVPGSKKAPKQSRKKGKKSSANADADWTPELEEVSLLYKWPKNNNLLSLYIAVT